MNKRAQVSISKFSASVLLAVVGIFVASAVSAKPDGSQRLRGLAGRVMHVTVEVTRDDFLIFQSIFGVSVGTTFPNCYIFSADANDAGNNWFESAFPTQGFWSQASNGAKTSYFVSNQTGFEQSGRVTPARGKGVLQLEAVSTIAVAGLEFVSTGAEVQGSDIDDCPTGPEFTPPPAP